MKTKNMYIEALRIAYHQPFQQISFNDLAKKLKELGYKFETPHRTTYFTYWYYTNFYNPGLTPLWKNGTLPIGDKEFTFHNAPDTFFTMTSEALDTYLEYENLLQAKKDAKAANRYAQIAIWITAIIGFIQIILSVR